MRANYLTSGVKIGHHPRPLRCYPPTHLRPGAAAGVPDQRLHSRQRSAAHRQPEQRPARLRLVGAVRDRPSGARQQRPVGGARRRPRRSDPVRFRAAVRRQPAYPAQFTAPARRPARRPPLRLHRARRRHRRLCPRPGRDRNGQDDRALGSRPGLSRRDFPKPAWRIACSWSRASRAAAPAASPRST